MNTTANLGDIALKAVKKAFAPSLAILANEKKFCIYGAGDMGTLLFHLCEARGIKPACFLDDLSPDAICCGLPVLPVKKGVEQTNPDAVLLATIRATERMTKNLRALPYAGRVLSAWDSNAHCRSEHCPQTITPKSVINQFHNQHNGQRAFIIGNGPSLLKTDPRRLKDEITFAANNIFLLENFTPTYYAAIDRVLTQDRATEINALPWIKFFPHLVSEWITNGFFLNAVHADWPTNFSTNISEFIEIDFTVTYSLMQIAFYMGCNPVYLIGVDHTYIVDMKQNHQDAHVLTSTGDDLNHFHPDYFGKGRRWHTPRMAPLAACYRKALDVYTRHGRELFNATAGGALEELPRVDFETIPGIPK